MTLRNTLLRPLGLALAYNADQRATAKYIWDFFLAVPGNTWLDAAAWCGNTDGETSFQLLARGDAKEAIGMAQWHHDRRAMILKHRGIDVSISGVADQCQAVLWEISQPPSWYRTVQNKMRLATTLQGKITVLVRDYEQSGSQDRDIARRTKLAQYWFDQFSNKEAA